MIYKTIILKLIYNKCQCKRVVARTKLGHMQAWSRVTLGMLNMIG